MTELERILKACEDARSRGVASLLATVVHVQGSTYRRPGARLLLTEDGQSVGTISGGCLEKEVHRKAWWLTAAGKPAVVRYDTRSGEDAVMEFGLGCQGVVDVLLERLPANALPGEYERVVAAVRSRTPCVLATIVGDLDDPALPVGERLFLGSDGVFASQQLQSRLPELLTDARSAMTEGRSRGRCYETNGEIVRVFIEAIVPPPHLLIVGAGPDAVPVARLAKQVGWDVTVADGRSAYANPARFPHADRVVAVPAGELDRAIALDPRIVAVLMTHNLADDLAALRRLLASPVRYVGVLGPRSRTDALIADLAVDHPSWETRLHAPIGLDIGAEAPEEIALAIIAEIRAALAGHPAGFLRERRGPIHRPPLADAGMDDLASRPTANVESEACPTKLPS
jgi:xanthine/CO dehydrogenase XdhC/CoxF family maturation factor